MPSAYVTCPTRRSPGSKRPVAQGVERIVKWTARTNRSKAPGPVGQSVPQAFDYHIDWETAATATAA